MKQLKIPLRENMRIHCKNAEEAKKLQEITVEQGFGTLPFVKDENFLKIEDTVFVLHRTGAICWSDRLDISNTYEFSELLLSETTMTATDVLKWLKERKYKYSDKRKEYEDLFGDLTVDELLGGYPTDKIVSSIEDYENKRTIIKKQAEAKHRLEESIDIKMNELLASYYEDLEKEDGYKYSGDITPDQTEEWDCIVKDMADFFEQLAEQNRK